MPVMKTFQSTNVHHLPLNKPQEIYLQGERIPYSGHQLEMFERLSAPNDGVSRVK